jgi:hypothetical protein
LLLLLLFSFSYYYVYFLQNLNESLRKLTPPVGSFSGATGSVLTAPTSATNAPIAEKKPSSFFTSLRDKKPVPPAISQPTLATSSEQSLEAIGQELIARMREVESAILTKFFKNVPPGAETDELKELIRKTSASLSKIKEKMSQ